MKKFFTILLSIMVAFTFLSGAEGSDAEKKSGKGIYIFGGYNFGFGTNNIDVKYTSNIYKENVNQEINYKLKTGNSFNIGAGYKLSRKFALELGFEVVSKDYDNHVKIGVPHPLMFDNPRVYDGKINNLSASSSVITLNGVYSIFSNKKFEVNVFGGVSVFLAKAELLSNVEYTESNYPYSTVDFKFYKKEVKKTIFGFNGGLRVHYKLSKKFDVFVKGAYYYGKKEFDPGNSSLTPELDFSGMRVGAGIRYFIK